jgi:hypothetical protein
VQRDGKDTRHQQTTLRHDSHALVAHSCTLPSSPVPVPDLSFTESTRKHAHTAKPMKAQHGPIHTCINHDAVGVAIYSHVLHHILHTDSLHTRQCTDSALRTCHELQDGKAALAAAETQLRLCNLLCIRCSETFRCTTFKSAHHALDVGPRSIPSSHPIPCAHSEALYGCTLPPLTGLCVGEFAMAQEGQLRTLSLALECPWLTWNEPLAIGHDNQILHTIKSAAPPSATCST